MFGTNKENMDMNVVSDALDNATATGAESVKPVATDPMLTVEVDTTLDDTQMKLSPLGKAKRFLSSSKGEYKTKASQITSSVKDYSSRAMQSMSNFKPSPEGGMLSVAAYYVGLNLVAQVMMIIAMPVMEHIVVPATFAVVNNVVAPASEIIKEVIVKPAKKVLEVITTPLKALATGIKNLFKNGLKFGKKKAAEENIDQDVSNDVVPEDAALA